VFQAMLANAVRICEAKFGALYLCEGKGFRTVALHGAPPALAEARRAAPIGSRHERMLWAARKIARLTGATEGGVYQTLLVVLIEAERLPRGSILGFSMTADE
jgi:hypothetical protein